MFCMKCSINRSTCWHNSNSRCRTWILSNDIFPAIATFFNSTQAIEENKNIFGINLPKINLLSLMEYTASGWNFLILINDIFVKSLLSPTDTLEGAVILTDNLNSIRTSWIVTSEKNINSYPQFTVINARYSFQENSSNIAVSINRHINMKCK